MKAIFLQALAASDKESALREVVNRAAHALDNQRFEVDTSSFAAVPNSPFAYWVSDEVRALFTDFPAFESGGRTARVGLQTSDDFRFVRAWWATSPDVTSKRWFPFTKGGGASAFYTDISLSVNWADDGKELKAFAESTPGTTHWSRNIRNTDSYFRAGFSWATRTSRFAPSCVPAGCIFSVSRYQAFVDESFLLATIAFLNASTCTALLRMSSDWFSRPKFIVGIVQPLPVPNLASSRSELASLGRRAWSLKRSLDAGVEVSHAFLLPVLLQIGGDSLAARVEGWSRRARAVGLELDEIQAELDERAFDLYGIAEADRRAISEGFASGVADFDAKEPGGEPDEADDAGDADAVADAERLTAELVSWAVGAAFGRFDVRLATGERGFPVDPEPFAALPTCSPGMLVAEDGLPVVSPPDGYPLAFPKDGIRVDDPGDVRDLTAGVRAVFDLVFGVNADALWDEAAALLDPRGRELRAWLRSGFIERHMRLHSSSRRQAPIVWQLGTPSGRYSVWLYAHRLTNDSFFQLQNDVLAPKLAYEERQLTNLVQSAGGSPSAADRREIEAQERFVEELRVMLEEVKRVAPLWKPTLDDGIVLVMAPLWRLVPHKPWQRELKKKWSELAAGKYDWAQLAMHLWPERVIAECCDDRSLAIAHSLEEAFWIEDEDGKWHPRQGATTGVNELIRKRTSAAVRDALGALS